MKKLINYTKYFLFFLLIFLLGAKTYAKTELFLPLNNICFSTELNQNFKSLEKDLQPNIGFLKEKCTFVIFEGVSAQNQYKFFEYFAGNLADAGGKVARSLDEILVNGKIPVNSKTNNKFHKWFDDLTPEELDLVMKDEKLVDILEDRIRYRKDGVGYHEWCMVCRVKQFKNWEVPMSEIHRFRTETLKLKWTVPNDVPTKKIRGLSGGHGGKGSTTFHNELKKIIDDAETLSDFNKGLDILVKRWKIDPKLIPPLITK